MKSLSRYLDHAVLKPEMTLKEVEAAIRLGLEYNTRTVCVRPCDIDLAKKLCHGTTTYVCAVLGFPHGCGLTKSKVQEARLYAEIEIPEVDMVSNYGWIRSGNWDAFKNEVAGIHQILRPRGILLKVILETAQLDLPQIAKATRICADIGADYVKTSTGFGGEGATIEAVQTMIGAAEGKIKVKASGGIRTIEQANRFIEMGCERLGIGFSTTPVLCGGNAPPSDSGY